MRRALGGKLDKTEWLLGQFITLRRLLVFASERKRREPSKLEIGDPDVPLIGAFPDQLESHRNNGARTRNAQLAAPDRMTRTGRRDAALFALAVQTGLRASELIGLCGADVHLGPGAHVSCHAKGRKQRITPLTPGTVAILRAWLAERAGLPAAPLFTTQTGRALSRDALELRLAKYVRKATDACPSLAQKSVTMQVLRHSAAMRLLRAGIDTSVIALWLGHEQIETTQIYRHADLDIKQRALDKTAPINTKPGRFRPSDKLLAFLETL